MFTDCQFLDGLAASNSEVVILCSSSTNNQDHFLLTQCTSGYHISLTVSNTIFSFWLLLTVVNQIGLPGHLDNRPGLVPWTNPGLLYGLGLLMMALGCRGVRGSFGMALVQGYFSVSCQIRCVMYHHDQNFKEILNLVALCLYLSI